MRPGSLLFHALFLGHALVSLGCGGAGREAAGLVAHPHGPTPSGDEGSITLVESAPVETTLDHPGVPNASDVWLEMIDGARATLDFAEFYASEAEPKDRATSKLAPVLAAIERAAARGVRVRFLADAVFAPKYPETLERLRAAGVTVRIFDMAPLGGGVLHAKYFVADGSDAFLGSQNFDWRALSHIQEMGVRVRAPRFASALLDVFEGDWARAGGAGGAGAADAGAARGIPHDRGQHVAMKGGEDVSLVASPRGLLPDEGSWDLPRLVALLDGARRAIDLQVLTYKTKDRAGEAFPTLDDALRRAAARGARVRVLVSDWSAKPGSESRAALESLAKVPGVDVRVITIPAFSGGEIPFARVAHAKYLVVDDERAWVGTSNWEGDYFTKSRNVGVVVERGALPRQLEGVFAGGWQSAYVAPLVTGPAGAAPPAASAPRAGSDPARP